MNTAQYLGDYEKSVTLKSKGTLFAKFCVQAPGEELPLVIDYNLLSIVYSGRKKIVTVHGEIEVGAGEAFFLAKGEYMSSKTLGDEAYTCVVVTFDDYVSAKLLSQMPPKDYSGANAEAKGIFKINQTPLITLCGESFRLLAQGQIEFSYELLELKLKETMLLLLDGEYSGSFVRFFLSSMLGKNDLGRFMEENFDKDISLADFARLSGRSLSVFKKDFKKIFKETPMKWLLGKRLERAKFLIESMDYAVGLAAYESGFKSHAHFCRCFKDKFHASPTLIVKTKTPTGKH